jgi:hypothetical protein
MGWQEQNLAAPVIKTGHNCSRQDGGVLPRARIKGKAAYCGNNVVISTTSSRPAGLLYPPDAPPPMEGPSPEPDRYSPSDCATANPLCLDKANLPRHNLPQPAPTRTKKRAPFEVPVFRKIMTPKT